MTVIQRLVAGLRHGSAVPAIKFCRSSFPTRLIHQASIADLPELMEMGVFQGCGSGSGCLKPAAACDDARAGPFIGYLMPAEAFTTATAASFRRRKGSVNGAS